MTDSLPLAPDHPLPDASILKTTETFILKEEGQDGIQPNGTFKARWDSLGGCWSIGPGLTQGITKATVMTGDQVMAAFHKEILPFEEGVEKALKVPVNGNQYAALVSFAYNVGLGDFLHSTLLRVLNSGHSKLVPGQLALWVHARAAKGVVPGLVNRRNAEIRLWNLPVDHPAVQVASADYAPLYNPDYPMTVAAVTEDYHDDDDYSHAFGVAMPDPVPTVAAPEPTIAAPVSATNMTISQPLQLLEGLGSAVVFSAVGYVVGNADQISTALKGAPAWIGLAVGIGITALRTWYVSKSNAATKQVVANLVSNGNGNGH